MAKLYYDPAGNLIALAHNDDEESRYFATPLPGQHASSPLVFDETTNQAIIDSLDGRVQGFVWQDHAVIAGALQRKSVPQSIAVDSADTARRKQAKALISALDAGTATAAQTQKAVAFLLKQTFKG